jgi:hypothetical protein
MRLRLMATVPVALMASIASHSAEAAMLDVNKGGILVNTGSGFKPGTVSQILPIGTQVVASPNSEGRVYYNDTCFVRVFPGQVYTVITKPPCNPADLAKSAANPPEPGNLSGQLANGPGTSPTGGVGGAGGTAGGAGGGIGGGAAAGGAAAEGLGLGLGAGDFALAGGLAAAAGFGIYKAIDNSSSP